MFKTVKLPRLSHRCTRMATYKHTHAYLVTLREAQLQATIFESTLMWTILIS